MKRLLVCFLFFAGLQLTSQAQKQSSKTSDKNSKTVTEKIEASDTPQEFFKGVDLSSDQVVQLKAQQKAYKEQQLTILTPEQRIQYEDLKKQKKAKRIAAEQAEMKKMLGLSEAQAKRWTTLHDNNMLAIQNIKDNEDYSIEDKKNKFKEVYESTEEERMSILNAEQKKKLEAYEKEMKEKKASKKNSSK